MSWGAFRLLGTDKEAARFSRGSPCLPHQVGVLRQEAHQLRHRLRDRIAAPVARHAGLAHAQQPGRLGTRKAAERLLGGPELGGGHAEKAAYPAASSVVQATPLATSQSTSPPPRASTSARRPAVAGRIL